MTLVAVSSDYNPACELERHRAGEMAALEALEVGDVGYAIDVLLALVESGGPEPVLRCPDCWLDCHWPGRLDVHRMNVHRVELVDVVLDAAA